jgi:molybdopterin molybdotransferase
MTLLSVRAAQERILKHFEPVETETLPLGQCGRRVLASDIGSSDLPLFDNSSVDGFAVIASDLSGASTDSPRTLRVVASIPAGSASAPGLRPGQAAQIMTGAPIPPAADAVIMIEDIDSADLNSNLEPPFDVRAQKSVRPGENIRARGMDLKSGRKVLFAGHRIRPQELGMLAMLNVAAVQVFRRPRAALLSSGDELVAPGAPLPAGKIRDTNSYTLAALLEEAGCDVLPLGIAPDNRDAIQFRLKQATAERADLIVSSAGVSVGALDLMREIVASEGQLDFWRVDVRPGKPLAVGDYLGIPFIGLPGNPVSAFVGFELFVRPALARLAGLKSGSRPTVKVQLAEAVESDGRESYLRAITQDRGGTLYLKLTGHQGSGNLLSLVEANALLIVPAGVKSLAVGDPAEAWLL